MNVATIEIALPAQNSPGPAHAAAFSLPAFSAHPLAGFVSLLNGLLNQSTTATSGGAVSQPAKPTGGPNRRIKVPDLLSGTLASSIASASAMSAPLYDQPPTAERAATRDKAAKEKEENPGNATNAATSFVPSMPAPVSEPLVISQPVEAAALLTTISGIAAENSVTLSRTQTPGSMAPTRSQPQAAAPPNSLSTSLAPSSLSPSGASLDSAHNLAFALELSWQIPASGTEAVVHSELEAGPSSTADASHSNAALNLSDKSAAVSESAATLDLLDTKNPQTIQALPVGSTSSRETVQSADFSSRQLQPEVLSAGAGPVRQDEGKSRTPEVSPPIRPSNASAIFAPQNRGLGAVNRNSSATRSSKIIPSAELNPAKTDTEPEGLTKAGPLVAEKTAPESGDSTASHSFTPRTTPPTERPTPHTQDDEAPVEQSEASRGSAGAKSETGVATRPETGVNNSGTTTNAKDDAGSSESDEKIPKALSAQKGSEVQGPHEHPGMSADGVLLGRPGEPAGAPLTRAKTLAPQPSQPAAASPDTETTQAMPSQPIRDVSLRLTVAESAHVDVQLAERAGKIQVAVRTPDQDLAKSLQSNLGELVSRLEDKGYKTNVLGPVTTQHSGLAVKESSTSPDSQSHSNGSGSQGGQQDPRGRQQQSDQRQQGRWKAQLEETFLMPNAPNQTGA